MKINIVLRLDAPSQQYEVDIPMDCLDLVNRKILEGQFADFKGDEPKWKALISAVGNGTPLADTAFHRAAVTA